MPMAEELHRLQLPCCLQPHLILVSIGRPGLQLRITAGLVLRMVMVFLWLLHLVEQVTE